MVGGPAERGAQVRQLDGEPRVGLAAVADCPTAPARRLPAPRSSGHARCGSSSAAPVCTSCSSANWRMVSSIENRVRSADRSATNSDLRTRASSRSSDRELIVGARRPRRHPARSNPPANTEHLASKRLFGIVEQVVGPLHGVAQRLVALQSAPRADEQPEPVVQPIAHLGDRHRQQARRGQLDRQRDPVEASADLDDGARVV